MLGPGLSENDQKVLCLCEIWDIVLGDVIVLVDVMCLNVTLQVATRLAYGTALVKIGKNNSRVIALDGDTKNSTFSQKFKVRNHAVLIFIISCCVKNIVRGPTSHRRRLLYPTTASSVTSLVFVVLTRLVDLQRQ